MRLDLPSAARNPISLIGVAITTAMAIVFIGLFALDAMGQVRNPYFGLLLFVAVPAIFIFGLLLIPIGVWRQRQRVRAGKATEEWPVIDLRLPRTRSVIFGVAVLTCVNLLIVSLAAYGTVHHMETAEFCGTTCHTTMEPEWKAYQVFPHSQVTCVSCHVGPGAGALVESKVAGTRQLWQLLSNSVPTPVAAPVKTMRPARETCQTCHWAEKRHGEKLRAVYEYGDDEASTETITRLQLHVGGGRAELGGSGIHWHMNIDNRVEYITTDPQRQIIPWVKLTDRDGHVREYTVEGTTPDELAGGERRIMDCMDCHNRPAHTFEPTPERAIDNAIAVGSVPRELPFTRREAVAAVKDDYESTAAAMSGIDARLRNFYGSRRNDAPVARLVSGVQQVYARNVFPAMKVNWGSYPNNLGHTFFNGCFRCHDDNHKTANGVVIKQDCESCHAFP